MAPVTVKGESSVVPASPSSCPNEVVDSNAMDAMRQTAFVSFCFILGILCLCLCLLPLKLMRTSLSLDYMRKVGGNFVRSY